MQQNLEIASNTSRFDLSDNDDEQKENRQDSSQSPYLDVKKLETWLNELKNQPRWRLVADKEMDYYDGNQLDAETLELMAERGQAPIIDNLVQPTINSVLGMQAKSRVDTRVEQEAGETNHDVAEALSVKMKKYAADSRSDRAKSDAYAEMAKVGISWLEVSKNANPFQCPVRYEHTNRKEIYWDWRSKKADLSDARYLVRRKWVDEDVLLATFPDKADFIKHALSGVANWDMTLSMASFRSRGDDSDFSSGFSTSIEQYEWMNTERKRMVVYEVWYRVVESGLVAKLPNGKSIEVDADDPAIAAVIQAGGIKPFKATYDKIRCAFWLGPQMIGDYPSPYKHRHFPYVPMFGFREDRTGIPYGLIRTMISPQDEINARKSKMYWLLSAKRVIATDKAVADHSVAAEEVARPDAYIVRSNSPNEIFEVQENAPMAAQQFQVMQEAKESIQTNVGVHNATLGRDSGATSGLAINSLVEQDSITLAELNDNFNMSARQADELMLSLIIEELSDEPNHVVLALDENGNDKKIVLNQIVQDPQTGQPTVINDLSTINVNVVLADTPSTPTFRNQQLNQMSELMKAMPPELQRPLFPTYIRNTDLPNKDYMAKTVEKSLGITTDDGKPQDPAVVQLTQQLQQAQQQIQALDAQIKAKNPPEIVAATVAKMQAEIDNIKSKTVETSAKGLYEAIQTAMAAAANPAIVPIADSIGRSIGFEDKNGGELMGADGQPQQGIPNAMQNVPSAQQVQPNPTLPANPQDPMRWQPPVMQQPQQVPSPDQGVAQGIEQQGNQVG